MREVVSVLVGQILCLEFDLGVSFERFAKSLWLQGGSSGWMWTNFETNIEVSVSLGFKENHPDEGGPSLMD